VIARTPHVAPGGQLDVPVPERYEVMATTAVDGKVCFSAPVTVTGAARLIAQVVQEYRQGAHVLDMLEVASSAPDELQFQTTWRHEVTFRISKDGRPLHDVVCRDAFSRMAIKLGDTFSFEAVVNGVTTDIQYSNDPNAICTLVDDTSWRSSGYYTLVIEDSGA
jgi:hypothetical protein